MSGRGDEQRVEFRVKVASRCAARWRGLSAGTEN